MSNGKTLTNQQEAFAQGLFRGLDLVTAYREAYPNQANNKLTTLKPNACKMAANPKVVARLAELRAPAIEKLQLDDTRMMLEYRTIMESDARDYLQWDDNGVHVKPSSELTDAQAKAVAGVSERVNAQGIRTIEVKLYDRTKAIDALAERLWPVPKPSQQQPGGNTYNDNRSITFGADLQRFVGLLRRLSLTTEQLETLRAMIVEERLALPEGEVNEE